MSSISSFIYWILIYCLFKTVFNIVPPIFTPQINGTSMNLFYRNREIGRENVYLVSNAVVQVCKISVKMQWMLSLVMGEGGEARLDCERRLQWTEWGKDGGEGNNNKIHNITITLVTQSYHLSHTEWAECVCFCTALSAKMDLKLGRAEKEDLEFILLFFIYKLRRCHNVQFLKREFI